MDCSKTAYETEDLALIKINEIKDKEKGTKKRIPIRAYKCDKCNYFHLTSFTKQKQKKIQDIYSSVQYKYRYEIRRVKSKKTKVKVLKFRHNKPKTD
jgi:hypothetical protein